MKKRELIEKEETLCIYTREADSSFGGAVGEIGPPCPVTCHKAQTSHMKRTVS